MPKDNFALLATQLKKLQTDPSFVFLLDSITAPTEQDAVAKAFVNFYTFQQTASPAITVFAAQEIKTCTQENTIFRNNSMASRMFKFYSKILGVPYIFQTLARFIVEINTIADRKSTATQSLLSVDVRPNLSHLSC